jgi:hypothetical protein
VTPAENSTDPWAKKSFRRHIEGTRLTLEQSERLLAEKRLVAVSGATNQLVYRLL